MITITIAFLLVLVFFILPFTLDRLDGTIKPVGKLPDSLSIEGLKVLPTQFFEHDGGTIAYDDSGTSGPLVICLPSMGDLRQEYRYLAPQLIDAGFRVVTMDVRGHGESSVDWSDYSAAAIGSDAIALIRHLNAGPAYIIGTSMAAGSAVWAAAEAPELVAGQVLIGAFVRDIPASVAVKLGINVLMAKPWGPSAWSMFYKSLYPTSLTPDQSLYRGALKANLREPGRFAALQKMMAASKAECEARLDEVKSPSLVIMGTKDPDFKIPADEANWIAERLDGAMLMVEGAGHYPHAEMPDKVGPDIIAFLQNIINHYFIK